MSENLDPQEMNKPQPSQGPAIRALKQLPEVWMHMWHGRTTELFSAIFAKPFFAWVVAGIYVVAYALPASLLMARYIPGPSAFASFNSPERLLGSLLFSEGHYFLMTFGEWFAVFLCLIIGTIASIALRVATLMAVFIVRGAKISFVRGLTLYTVALAPVMVLFPILLLIAFLPLSKLIIFLMIVIGLLAAIASIFGELLLYVGINREAQMEKSPALPYAVATVAWIVLSFTFSAMILPSF